MNFEELKNKAIKLLSFREHSSKELARKLIQIGGSKDLIDLVDLVIIDLIQKDYLSDQRYAEVLIRSRAHKGYGPNYCKRALLQAGVSHEIIEQSMQNSDIDWNEINQKLINKRSKNSKNRDLKNPQEIFKLKRFLQGRGF